VIVEEVMFLQILIVQLLIKSEKRSYEAGPLGGSLDRGKTELGQKGKN
jgi:hypothetical protein